MLVLERGWGFKSPSAHKGKPLESKDSRGFFVSGCAVRDLCDMTFFQNLPVPPERLRPPRHVMPVWAGPPPHELPVTIHVGKFLHRAPGLVMEVTSAEVFSTGCAVHVVWTLRRTDEPDRQWAAVNERFSGSLPRARDSRPIPVPDSSSVSSYPMAKKPRRRTSVRACLTEAKRLAGPCSW